MTGRLTARVTTPGATFAASLARKAAALAQAQRALTARTGPWRWRRAALLWPLFAKDR